MPAAVLSQTIANYNELAQSGQQDAMGKPKRFFNVLDKGPYYALDCSADTLSVPDPEPGWSKSEPADR